MLLHKCIIIARDGDRSMHMHAEGAHAGICLEPTGVICAAMTRSTSVLTCLGVCQLCNRTAISFGAGALSAGRMMQCWPAG